MSQRYPTSLVAAYDQRVHHCRLAPTRSTWCTLGAGAGRLTMWSVGHPLSHYRSIPRLTPNYTRSVIMAGAHQTLPPQRGLH